MLYISNMKKTHQGISRDFLMLKRERYIRQD